MVDQYKQYINRKNREKTQMNFLFKIDFKEIVFR